MQFSLDLQAALKALEAWQETLPADKQRRFARYPVRGEARLWPGQANVTARHVQTVHLRDVSRGGASVVSSDPLAIGSFWQVQLGSGKIALRTLPGVCRYCRRVMTDAAAYLIGIEFGIESCLLLALGVPAKGLAQADSSEVQCTVGGTFVDPDALSVS